MKNQEDKVFLSKVLDKIKLCNKEEKMQYTDFLDMYQIALVKNYLNKMNIKNFILYGGYEDSERKVLLIYPENCTEVKAKEQFNKILKIIRIHLPEEDKGKYSHRNYLGGIVKLGLKREKVGDILVGDEGADILTLADFSTILKEQLPSLNRFEKSNIEERKISEIRKKEIKLEVVNIIVPSLRLDNFVSDLAKTSRNKANQIISQERVFINGQLETKNSKQVKLNDIITIRGKGRFVVKEFGGTTRSGRTVVIIEKYA